jgi:hypothetical protein
VSESEIAAKLVIALSRHADQAMADATSLVSISIEFLGEGQPGQVKTVLTRKTRTLVFLSAEFVSEAGVRIAHAASVHKVAG